MSGHGSTNVEGEADKWAIPGGGAMPPTSAPSAPTYGAPPPANNYGAPPPANNYGAPPPANNYGAPPPANNYGAPPPANNYGAPPPANDYAAPPPTNNYAAPPPTNNYAAPPPTNNYAAPPPTNNYAAPPPTNNYAAPPPTNNYSGNIYAQPPSGAPPTNNNPQYRIVGMLGLQPSRIKCPHCSEDVYTRVHKEPGAGTHVAAGVICLLGCWAGCCLIPYCVPDCQDSRHVCPKCNSTIGYKRVLG